MTANTGFLPCPFCGSSVNVTQVNLAPDQCGESWDMWCSKCEAIMADRRSCESVVAAWNHRTPHPDTAMLDAVERGGWDVQRYATLDTDGWCVVTRGSSHEAPTLRAAIERAIEETTK